MASDDRTRTVISIHALLAESDKILHLKRLKSMKFLSTLSLRRATLGAGSVRGISSNFYPRSPCGERPPRGGYCYLDNIISIHALLAESDAQDFTALHNILISIHALLAESDPGGPGPRNPRLHFYPRSPCGERQTTPPRPVTRPRFLSTLSLRRATTRKSDYRFR